VNQCEGWLVYLGDSNELIKNVVYVDDVSNEFGHADDPPRVSHNELLLEHKVAKRIAIFPETKVVRIWE
jgi:hypothetical protein